MHKLAGFWSRSTRRGVDQGGPLRGEDPRLPPGQSQWWGEVTTKALGVAAWEAQPRAVFHPCVRLAPFRRETNGTDGA